MSTWTIPHRWENAERVYAFDMNDFARDNLLFLRNEAASASLISQTFPSVTAASRDPGWKTISEFYMITYGKELFANLTFTVNNGSDTWPAGTIVVGEGDTTDIVERVGDVITRIAIRDGYTRSARWQQLLRQRQTINKRIRDMEDALANFPPSTFRQDIIQASREFRFIRQFTHRVPDGGRDLIIQWEREVQAVRDAMNEEGRIWRHRNILTPGEDRKVTESSQVSRTRVTTSPETISYDKVFIRLLFNGQLSREFIHDNMPSTDTGVFYLVNVPAGTHFVQLQWRSPQFTGHTPQSGTLISLSNLRFQIKELRYELLRGSF